MPHTKPSTKQEFKAAFYAGIIFCAIGAMFALAI